MTQTLRLTTFLLGGVLSGSYAQLLRRDTDTVIMGSGYRYQVYYQLRSGRQDTVPRCSWHLAFEVPIRGAAIRANHPCGVTVYKTTRDTSGWDELSLEDTVQALYDDLCRWEKGAFNTTAGSSAFDVGWGIYNLADHITRGDSLYIIRIGENFKKLWIQRLQGSNYFIRVANPDGSQDTSYAVPKTAAGGKNFVYLNLNTHQVIDLEPPPSNWDLLFTQYSKFITPSGDPNNPILYSLTGVLMNSGVRAVRVRLTAQANPDTLSPNAYVLDSCISVIGDDWKRFSGGAWSLADTLYFLVQDRAQNLWRLRFIGFEGSATGRAMLEKALLQEGSSSIATPLGEQIAIYPQPVREGIYVVVPERIITHIEFVTLTGQTILRGSFRGGEAIYIPRPAGLESGIYLMRIATPTGSWSRRVIFD
ncbi:MAG: T9SS type A sorting domain-containing protein [Bacteroidia bacterium]|nr:T9SS type A sorting domain-containing protein [Bacteroidia bacterium]MDW8015236.1 T9SS type A sorting domain-containing protein [Bacteroidia bacterium]